MGKILRIKVVSKHMITAIYREKVQEPFSTNFLSKYFCDHVFTYYFDSQNFTHVQTIFMLSVYNNLHFSHWYYNTHKQLKVNYLVDNFNELNNVLNKQLILDL